MKRTTAGFTLIELVIVILIGSILVSVALSTFQNAQAAFSARGAKTMYATLHQRARARAIELGQSVVLVVNTNGDSAYMISNGDTTEQVNFRRELNVDLRSTPVDSFLICMTPRGYADYHCPNSTMSGTSANINLQFWLNADSTSVWILPMGQLVGM